MSFADLRDDALEWSRGRSWYLRGALLLYLAYAGFRYLLSSEYSSWFSGIIFGVHELGHVLFSFAGQFLMTAGGSLAQLGVPVAAGAVLLMQRDYFGVGVAGAWLSYSLFEMADYVADARAQRLPLLGLSDQPGHDWNYMLSAVGLLQHDTAIAFLVRGSGFLILLASLWLCLWLCLNMARGKASR